MKSVKIWFWAVIIVIGINFIGGVENTEVDKSDVDSTIVATDEQQFIGGEVTKNALSDIPAYSGIPYVIINDNVPFFNDTDLTNNSYEKYSNLDALGRCGVTIACIGKDIMPTEERGNIGSVKPTGWHTVRYAGIDGNYLYNRCHLIGYQLTAENANEKNLITGTRYMNVQGMLPFENLVADYIKETNNHVLYRVTPIFQEDNLLASGVLMEAKSVEDNGTGIEFNVYCYNVQPGIEINYVTGESSGPEYTGSTTNNNTKDSTTTTSINSQSDLKNSEKNNSTQVSQDIKQENNYNQVIQDTKYEENTSNNITYNYILNTNTKKFHEPGCSSVKKMSEKNKENYTGSRSDLISQGYDPCGNCNP